MKRTYFGFIGAGVIIVVLIVIGWRIHGSIGSKDFAISALIGTTGITLGWFIGFLGAPNSSKEEDRFTKYSAALTSLISGYVLGKIDPLVTLLISENTILKNQSNGINLLIFLICLIVGFISMYSFRMYLPKNISVQ
jgi:hypothetical protein